MDPLTLSMAIAPLILTSARLAILVAVVRDSYTKAPTTLLSTLTECHLMHTALSRIHGLIFRNETELAARLQGQKCLHEAFDKALTGCRITLTALNLEVEKLVEPKQQQGKMKEGPMEIKICAKVKLIWKEDAMRHLLEHTRGLTVSLHFIITILESETINEILKPVKENNAIVEKVLNRAKTIRSDQGFKERESSFHSAQQIVVYGLAQSYEEQLMQSSAYQKSQPAAAEELLARKLEFLEEKYELEERIEGLREEMTSTEEKVTKLEDQISSKNEGMFLKSNRISELERELKTHRQDMLLKSNRISELERELATHRQDMLLEKGTQLKLQNDLSLREKDIRELRQVNRLDAERMHRARQILGSSDDESGLQHTKTESVCVNHDSGLSKEKRNPQKKTRHQPDKTDGEKLAVSQDAMSAKGIQSTLGSDWPEQLLKWAAETGDAEVAGFVCKRNPKSHRQYQEALNIASIKGHSKIIKILLEALPGIRPPAGLVLQAAIGRKYQLAEQLLLAGAPVSGNDAVQIHYAIEGDDAVRNGVLGSVQLDSVENILTMLLQRVAEEKINLWNQLTPPIARLLPVIE